MDENTDYCTLFIYYMTKNHYLCTRKQKNDETNDEKDNDADDGPAADLDGSGTDAEEETRGGAMA
jgi:hypothetical protein